MPINYGELIKAAEVVAEKKEMSVSLKFSFVGATLTACRGTIIGGVLAALYSRGKFKSVVSIIREDLSESEKLKLAEHLEKAVKDFQITDLSKILILLTENEALCNEVYKELKLFIENERNLRMPINYGELIEAAEVVAEKEQMKVSLKYAFAGATFTTCTTLIGGIVGGPIGLGVGGTLGGVLAAIYTRGKFKSVVSIIREDLSESQKIKLAEHLERAVKDFQITDLAKILILLKSNEALYLEIFKALKYFLENEMKLELTE